MHAVLLRLSEGGSSRFLSRPKPGDEREIVAVFVVAERGANRPATRRLGEQLVDAVLALDHGGMDARLQVLETDITEDPNARDMPPPAGLVERYATDAELDDLVLTIDALNTNPGEAGAGAWRELATRLRTVADYCDRRAAVGMR